MADEKASAVQQAGRITDARGRTVSQLDPVMMHLLHRPGIVPPDALRDISQQVGFGITRATRVAFWGSVVGLVCLGIALAICLTRLSAGTISTGRFIRSLIPYGSVLSGVVLSWVSLRAARHEKIGKVMLNHRRCPHCAYDLRGLAMEGQDNATVCPECRCAWRIAERSTA